MRDLTFIISWLLAIILLHSCNAQPKKNDFIAQYYIDKNIPIDTTSRTQLAIKKSANWKISLEEKDNFQLTGIGKHIVGYWNVQKVNNNEYKLLLQGGGWTIYGRFDGTSMYFDYPYRMFDSLFSQVTFTKNRK